LLLRSCKFLRPHDAPELELVLNGGHDVSFVIALCMWPESARATRRLMRRRR
jgi:hypothetical protein